MTDECQERERIDDECLGSFTCEPGRPVHTCRDPGGCVFSGPISAAWNDPLPPPTGHGCLGERIVWPMGSGGSA